MSTEKYLKIVRWAFRRYSEPGGRLAISIDGGKPTRYAKIENAAWNRYMRKGGAK